MKRTLSILFVIVGVAAIALGLLFLVGSGGQTRRLIVAALALAAGAVLVGFGIRWFKAADRLRPGFIRAEILELARRKNGEISADDLESALGERWPHALMPLSDLLSGGACRKQVVDGEDFYVFPDLQPRLVRRRCEFCSAELPLDESLTSCPNCGGTFRTGVERVSLSRDEAYHMDEQ